MPDLANLRASCRAVLARHQSNLHIELQCVICQQRMRGQDNSMEHYITAHSVYPVHFDDVADMEGFLSCLKELLFPKKNEDRSHICCPVCLESFDNEALWATHIEKAGHNKWNPESIPALADFCIDVEGSVGAAKENEEEDVDGMAEGDFVDESDDEDWDVEPALCLFCDDESVDCLKHMIDAHAFDFRAAVQSHEGVKDLYDIIRLVNVTRRCVSRGECPWHYGSAAAAGKEKEKEEEEDGELQECRQDVANSSLEEHLRSRPQHSLPRIVPQGDRDLIPVIPGDAFISSIVIGGNLVSGNEADPDYPMVPTITEMAQSRVAKKEAD